jgi:hypothetical protein
VELTEGDIREIRQQGDLRSFLADLQAEARTRNEQRKAAVLAHPDLAARLLDKPLALERPEQWTGYLAPTHNPSGAPNRSPVREQLAALIAEAEARAARPAPAATPGARNETA